MRMSLSVQPRAASAAWMASASGASMAAVRVEILAAPETRGLHVAYRRGLERERTDAGDPQSR